jgi:hypothetical protein
MTKATVTNQHRCLFSTNGAPVSYTAIYLGCHYANCSPGTNLPMQVSQISSATSSEPVYDSYCLPGA